MKRSEWKTRVLAAVLCLILVCTSIFALAEDAAHTHEWVPGETAEPTCTENGYTLYSCSCGAVEKQNEIAAKGHDWQVAVSYSPTCDVNGYTEYKCTVCGESKADDLIPAPGHEWGEWQVKQAPSCEQEGLEVRSCTRSDCKKEESRVTPAGHDWDENNVCKLCKAFAAAKIGSVLYTSLQDAVDASKKDETVVLLADGTCLLQENRTILLDENSFSADIQIPSDCKLVREGNSYTALREYAETDGVTYTSLASAIAAAKPDGVVTVLGNEVGSGITVDKNLTINFNGYTYTAKNPGGVRMNIDGDAQGSAFELKKGTQVVLKNGMIKGTGNARYLVQNNADALTLDDMMLNAVLNANLKFALSNNRGEVVLTGDTVINGGVGQWAIDLWKDGSECVNLTVAKGMTGAVAGYVRIHSDSQLSIEDLDHYRLVEKGVDSGTNYPYYCIAVVREASDDAAETPTTAPTEEPTVEPTEVVTPEPSPEPTLEPTETPAATEEAPEEDDLVMAASEDEAEEEQTDAEPCPHTNTDTKKVSAKLPAEIDEYINETFHIAYTGYYGYIITCKDCNTVVRQYAQYIVDSETPMKKHDFSSPDKTCACGYVQPDGGQKGNDDVCTHGQYDHVYQYSDKVAFDPPIAAYMDETSHQLRAHYKTVICPDCGTDVSNTFCNSRITSMPKEDHTFNDEGICICGYVKKDATCAHSQTTVKKRFFGINGGDPRVIAISKDNHLLECLTIQYEYCDLCGGLISFKQLPGTSFYDPHDFNENDVCRVCNYDKNKPSPTIAPTATPKPASPTNTPTHSPSPTPSATATPRPTSTVYYGEGSAVNSSDFAEGDLGEYTDMLTDEDENENKGIVAYTFEYMDSLASLISGGMFP